MKPIPKKIAIPLLLTAAVFVLTIVPMGFVKTFIKDHAQWTYAVKARIEEVLRRPVCFSEVQDLMHFPFFAGLGFLWMWFFKRRGVAFVKAAVWAFAAVTVFSFTDEFVQAFVPSRDASWHDLLADLIGCAVGIAAYRLWMRRKGSRDV